jgi:hypothetical protein
MRSALRGIGVALTAGLVAGCASVSVKEDAWTQERLTMPEVIYVKNYEVPADVLAVDRSGQELEEFRRMTAENFTRELCDRISKWIAPAVPFEDGVRLESGAWVVEGEFVRLNQGSRLLRSVIGLGAGGTKMETRTVVSVVDARGRTKTIAQIETTGGSNAEPGMLTVPTPLGGGIRALISLAKTGVTADQRRSARMIAAAMAERLEEQGYQLAGQGLRARRLP